VIDAPAPHPALAELTGYYRAAAAVLGSAHARLSAAPGPETARQLAKLRALHAEAEAAVVRCRTVLAWADRPDLWPLADEAAVSRPASAPGTEQAAHGGGAVPAGPGGAARATGDPTGPAPKTADDLADSDADLGAEAIARIRVAEARPAHRSAPPPGPAAPRRPREADAYSNAAVADAIRAWGGRGSLDPARIDDPPPISDPVPPAVEAALGSPPDAQVDETRVHAARALARRRVGSAVAELLAAWRDLQATETAAVAAPTSRPPAGPVPDELLARVRERSGRHADAAALPGWLAAWWARPHPVLRTAPALLWSDGRSHDAVRLALDLEIAAPPAGPWT
jgi:hypothetical protein